MGYAMQVVLLAGGLGTRLSEETDLIPKPMVKIGPDPIILHIMKYYASFGHKDFLVAAGYKGEIVKDYFESRLHRFKDECGWTINVVDTGLSTGTGGRLLKLLPLLEQEFLMTYGDGLSNVDLDALIKHHIGLGKIATVTAVRPPPRFGSMQLDDGLVMKFSEKNPQDAGWINGGFFFLNKRVCELIQNLESSFESEPISQLVSQNELAAYQHEGWWHAMDTLRDKRQLESIWATNNAPWIR
jgi:glucose-1-phosphate cytidylyltransferase